MTLAAPTHKGMAIAIVVFVFLPLRPIAVAGTAYEDDGDRTKGQKTIRPVTMTIAIRQHYRGLRAPNKKANILPV